MENIGTAARLGALARAARSARGWSQQQVADTAGVSRRFVNMLEGGEHRNAELWRVLAVLQAVGVSLVGSFGGPPAGSAPAAPPDGVPSDVPSAAPDGFDLDAHLDSFRDRGRR